MGLYEGFINSIFPLVLEGGKLLLALGCISGCYIFMRGVPADAVKKIKYATIGYAILKCITVYITFIDKVVANIKF